MSQKFEDVQKTLDDWKYEVSCCIDEIRARDEEISRLKTQATNIPLICKHFQCVFEIESATTKSNYKRIEEWKRECPKICPKWRENNAEFND